ncbi:hypothetical protein DY120_07465 [Apilactobacillus micheneri]|uniref:Uncharacterized protein n=1 Tax=Apilactobacillus micheneri TaxID=1899430 RepID=A0ABY2Z0F6_9LACO|nr:hypothetical protein [Apilactobacillus micheneri]TPR23136.1 hypothetical protein DY114_07450 [Apilactobacillus micheneri]TPR24454.1 hypothetical protein DY111_07465 [Apilactobacillus micheneri]TPR29401.1 hypothetical protein DY120_07465 [Apilactobacillus micheneri]TPR34608.1 hypothetical protein DY027_07455 [Apilactobacillus micheneri]
MKHVSDVKMHLLMLKMANTNNQSIAILTGGDDDQAHSYTYNSIDDVTQFTEDSEVYDMVEKAFDIDYQGNVEVIVAPNKDVTPSGNLKATPNSDGAKVSNQSINRFVYALQQYAYDGFRLITNASDVTEKDLETVTDFLYQLQKVFLFAQFNKVADLQSLFNYSSLRQVTTSDKQNTVTGMVETHDRKPAVQVIAYGLANAPIDYEHIGNLPEMTEDDDLTSDDIQNIIDAHGTCVYSKAGDQMLLQGKSFGDNYIDEFINTTIVKSTYQYSLQKELNGFKNNHFDDKTIGLLVERAEKVSSDLMSQGYFDEKPKVDKTPRAQVNPSLVTKRHYKGITISAPIATSIDTMDVFLNLTE